MDSGTAFHVPVTDAAGIAACLDAHGVVAVTNVLTRAECDETLADMGLPAYINVRDPATYGRADAVLNRYGVLGDGPLFTAALIRNRCHPNVIAAYEAAYQLPAGDIIAQHDRIAWMRPTATGHMEWDTPFTHPGLHLDVDPQCYCDDDDGLNDVTRFMDGLEYDHSNDLVSENNAKHYRFGRHLQGVLNLIDNRHDDGGFQCVPMPDAAAWLRRWVPTVSWASRPEPNGRHIFTAETYGREGWVAQRVPCPAGTLLLFDAALPHGTQPNRSGRPRAIQFLRYIPAASLGCHAARGRPKLLERLIRDAKLDAWLPSALSHRARVALYGS